MSADQPLNPVWQKRWDDNQPNWQYDQVNPSLKSYFPTISSGVALEGKRFLVPLCGKTIDMKWLYDQGLTVVGVEAVEKGILEFFAEQELEFDRKDYDSYSVFSTKDSKLQIFKGNLFGFDEINLGGKFDYFFDRGSLVAIKPNDRETYVSFLAKVMKPKSIGLLEVFEYDQSLAVAHPYPIFLNDVTKLYQNAFEYEEVKRYSENYKKGLNRNEQVTVYNITRK